MKIGLISCEIQIVSDKVIHCSINESLSSSERQLPVTVSGGSAGRGSLAPRAPCPPQLALREAARWPEQAVLSRAAASRLQGPA